MIFLQFGAMSLIIGDIDANLLPVFLTTKNNTNIVKFSPLPGAIL